MKAHIKQTAHEVTTTFTLEADEWPTQGPRIRTVPNKDIDQALTNVHTAALLANVAEYTITVTQWEGRP